MNIVDHCQILEPVEDNMNIENEDINKPKKEEECMDKVNDQANDPGNCYW